MNNEDEHIPPSLVAKHPELQEIERALDLFIQGSSEKVACPKCGEYLAVTYIEAINTFWVTCPIGHIRFNTAGKIE